MWCNTVPTTEEALSARLLQSTIDALQLYSICLGRELGLYAALRHGVPLTPPELAETAGIASRYAREWLEQQAAAGLLEVRDASQPPDERLYGLPAGHLNVLVNEDHPAHLAPLSQMVAGIGGALEQVLSAYRTGGGVPYPQFGGAFRRGQAGINRPAFVHDLASAWLPAARDVHSALTSRSLRVADADAAPDGRRLRWHAPIRKPR